jgi:[ribosomal protein S5]-alanine N-acetyltransferase
MPYIETPRLRLENGTPEMVEAWLNDEPKLAALLRANISANWTENGPEVIQWVLDGLLSKVQPPEWMMYFTILTETNELIGTCGYKGPPNADGMVEIGYEVAAAYRNRGFATELAGGLTQHALANPAVQYVQAHTLAEENASGQVLQRNGFTKIGESNDPDEGLVWQWIIRK